MGFSHYTGVNLGCNMIMVNFRGVVSSLSICRPFYGLSGAINSVYIYDILFLEKKGLERKQTKGSLFIAPWLLHYMLAAIEN